MDLPAPPRKPRAESIVPMINVVFLLLIFFLMTSRLAPPEPFEVEPPEAGSETQPDAEPVIYVDKSGRLGFEQAEGAAALALIAQRAADAPVVQLRADAQVEARVLAGLLRDLSAAGLSRVELVVSQK